MEERGERKIDIFVLLEDVEHAEALPEHLLNIVSDQVLEYLGRCFRILGVEKDLKIALSRRLLEFYIAPEEAVDADRLADRQGGRDGGADLDLLHAV